MPRAVAPAAATRRLPVPRRCQIDRELGSLNWVTSPQRAATLEPAAFEICGWSGQLLVRFAVRAGRLCEWSQEPCDAAAAAPALAATPPGWAGFARRSAGLAAMLSA
jgi:excinuclease ABC subunit C